MVMNVSRRSQLWPRLVGAAWLLCLVAGPTAAVAGEDDFFTHLHTEKAMANVTVSPGRAGPVDIAIQLETADERPLAAKAVTVTLKSGSTAQTVDAKRVSDNSWQAKASIPEAGRWTLGLGISVSENDKISIEAPIQIEAAGKGGGTMDGKGGHHHRH